MMQFFDRLPAASGTRTAQSKRSATQNPLPERTWEYKSLARTRKINFDRLLSAWLKSFESRGEFWESCAAVRGAGAPSKRATAASIAYAEGEYIVATGPIFASAPRCTRITASSSGCRAISRRRILEMLLTEHPEIRPAGDLS